MRARPVYETVVESPATEALMRAVLALFEKIVHLSPNVSEDAYVAAMNADTPGWLADLVASGDGQCLRRSIAVRQRGQRSGGVKQG